MRSFLLVAAAMLYSLPLSGTAEAAQHVSDSHDRDDHKAAPVQRPWQFGGFVDFGYLRDFNNPPNKLWRSRGTTFHVDEPHANMFGAYAKTGPSKDFRWGAEFLVHGGRDAEVFGFSATAPNMAGNSWLGHIGLANVSYLAPVGKGLTIQSGIFTSLIGHDSLYAKHNANYTRPWGADFTPYLMMGVNAAYPFTDKLTGTFFAINGYWHLAHANRVPSSGFQLAYKTCPEITIKQTVLWGPHQANSALTFWRYLSDTIVEHRTDRLVAAAEFHFSTEVVDSPARRRAWWVAAQLPIRWNVRGPWSVAFRPEVAWDSDGRWTLAEQRVTAFTSTVEYRAVRRAVDMAVRFEHRFDVSRGPGGGFFDDGENSPGAASLKPSQHLLILGLLLSIDSRR